MILEHHLHFITKERGLLGQADSFSIFFNQEHNKHREFKIRGSPIKGLAAQKDFRGG